MSLNILQAQVNGRFRGAFNLPIGLTKIFKESNDKPLQMDG